MEENQEIIEEKTENTLTENQENQPDSEDICFVPDGNYKKFLENNSNLRPKEGNIVNKEGKIIG